jgi:hypothetical protein
MEIAAPPQPAERTLAVNEFDEGLVEGFKEQAVSGRRQTPAERKQHPPQISATYELGIHAQTKIRAVRFFRIFPTLQCISDSRGSEFAGSLGVKYSLPQEGICESSRIAGEQCRIEDRIPDVVAVWKRPPLWGDMLQADSE